MKRTFPVTPIFTIGTPSRPVTSDQLTAAAPPPIRREGPATPIDIPITPPRTDRMSSYDRGKCVALELDENTVPAELLETRNINLSFLIGFFKHSECYLRKTSYENIIKEMKNLGCAEIFSDHKALFFIISPAKHPHKEKLTNFETEWVAQKFIENKYRILDAEDELEIAEALRDHCCSRARCITEKTLTALKKLTDQLEDRLFSASPS